MNIISYNNNTMDSKELEEFDLFESFRLHAQKTKTCIGHNVPLVEKEHVYLLKGRCWQDYVCPCDHGENDFVVSIEITRETFASILDNYNS